MRFGKFMKEKDGRESARKCGRERERRKGGEGKEG